MVAQRWPSGSRSGWNSRREFVKGNFIVQAKKSKETSKNKQPEEKVTCSTCLNKEAMKNKNNKNDIPKIREIREKNNNTDRHVLRY